ncbi:hypothetical protein [Chryseobacterium sp. ERMR1:04]|uniref:bacteriocin-like protein n=1 Tax=Chryseobacterium sp. ERMR1:04 TaxID=1705393 RepID=UPI000A9BF862|nr:hypothetical protein [Chryseobacterium sp. ERMR1:04]
MKNVKKLSREELKSVSGGYSCYCGNDYAGDFVLAQTCVSVCSMWDILKPVKPTNPH